ncbi:MAG: hypothetical protein VX703_01690 [Candidatus Neomarinimicrobiota bacterium]|nr:hypothetical protein [Candidatus Neomarinimicrobiota bacterium]MEC9455491.1 hypothetical protein [Candidatus Neomarinimicrobiota bacterium]
MQIQKNFFITLLSCSFVFAQTLQVNDATLSSEGYNTGTTLGITDTDVVIYSNALVHNLYVWGIPWYTDTKTFPAQITLPLDNRAYVISLYKKSIYKSVSAELQTFDFDSRPVEEFEALQDELQRMKIGTKLVRPIPGKSESVFLVYCPDEDISCEEGLHWRDGFLAKFYDQQQEVYMHSQLNKPSEYLSEEEAKLIKRHRGGVGMLVGFFSMGIWLLDRSLQ